MNLYFIEILRFHDKEKEYKLLEIVADNEGEAIEKVKEIILNRNWDCILCSIEIFTVVEKII